jgi:hypothetical protein
VRERERERERESKRDETVIYLESTTKETLPSGTVQIPMGCHRLALIAIISQPGNALAGDNKARRERNNTIHRVIFFVCNGFVDTINIYCPKYKLLRIQIFIYHWIRCIDSNT